MEKDFDRINIICFLPLFYLFRTDNLESKLTCGKLNKPTVIYKKAIRVTRVKL